MIVTYIAKYQPLQAEPVPHEACPLCHKEGSLTATLYASYVAIGFFWTPIPALYTGKRVSVHCTSCGHILRDVNYVSSRRNADTGKLTPGVEATIAKIKNYKVPLWRRLWLSLFFVCVIAIPAGWLTTSIVKSKFSQEQIQRTDELLAHPQAGDIYKSEFYVTDENSTKSVPVLVKVMRIDDDTMYIARTKVQLDMSANRYDEKSWDILSRNDDAFEDKEYKISLSGFLEEDRTMHRKGYFYLVRENKKQGEFDIVRKVSIGNVFYDFNGKLKIVERAGEITPHPPRGSED